MGAIKARFWVWDCAHSTYRLLGSVSSKKTEFFKNEEGPQYNNEQ